MVLESKSNEFIGYHTDCDGKIWGSDFIRFEEIPGNRQGERVRIFKCIRCKVEVREDELIPF